MKKSVLSTSDNTQLIKMSQTSEQSNQPTKYVKGSVPRFSGIDLTRAQGRFTSEAYQRNQSNGGSREGGYRSDRTSYRTEGNGNNGGYRGNYNRDGDNRSSFQNGGDNRGNREGGGYRETNREGNSGQVQRGFGGNQAPPREGNVQTDFSGLTGRERQKVESDQEKSNLSILQSRSQLIDEARKQIPQYWALGWYDMANAYETYLRQLCNPRQNISKLHAPIRNWEWVNKCENRLPMQDRYYYYNRPAKYQNASV